MIDFDKTGLLTYPGLLARETDIMKKSHEDQDRIYALIDIDFFKRYNTHLGYEEADVKLRQLAALFRGLEESVG